MFTITLKFINLPELIEVQKYAIFRVKKRKLSGYLTAFEMLLELF